MLITIFPWVLCSLEASAILRVWSNGHVTFPLFRYSAMFDLFRIASSSSRSFSLALKHDQSKAVAVCLSPLFPSSILGNFSTFCYSPLFYVQHLLFLSFICSSLRPIALSTLILHRFSSFITIHAFFWPIPCVSVMPTAFEARLAG